MEPGQHIRVTVSYATLRQRRVPCLPSGELEIWCPGASSSLSHHPAVEPMPGWCSGSLSALHGSYTRLAPGTLASQGQPTSVLSRSFTNATSLSSSPREGQGCAVEVKSCWNVPPGVLNMRKITCPQSSPVKLHWQALGDLVPLFHFSFF